ncbi:MarR family transcriptional regulator [Donghicola sp.]|jgi:DNA-binding MarR family transcriptional regulator|uniref:MarR family winged helix-turn-helix transcriptional regulator n=1 Tax=Donghicola sp. TaxID=1929294 RepID=UPI0025CD5B26|nr:MarR family transcriptional regulator [Donghicola sp.]MCT4575764.1 MarR family transcriptional regulator [Donghicola sp.]
MHASKMAGHLIRRMNQISTHVFSQRMQAEGRDLTPVQFAALDAIIANPGIDQASVAARIAYDRATIGGVIDRLEQKGYVERTISRRDRRAREVRATKLGQKEFDAILPIVEALQNDVLAGLDDPEKELFRTLAQKVIDYDAG